MLQETPEPSGASFETPFLAKWLLRMRAGEKAAPARADRDEEPRGPVARRTRLLRKPGAGAGCDSCRAGQRQWSAGAEGLGDGGAGCCADGRGAASLRLTRRPEIGRRARCLRLRSGRAGLPGCRVVDRRLHRSSTEARRAPCRRRRCRPRPAPRFAARKSAGDEFRGSGHSHAGAGGYAGNASPRRHRCQLHLAQARPAGGCGLARAASRDRGADQAAIRGRTGGAQEGHRPGRGDPAASLRRHRRAVRHAGLHRRRTDPLPIEGGDGNREFLVGARRKP